MAVLIGYTSYNRLRYTRHTLPILLDWLERTGAEIRVVVVDDGSDDGSQEWLKKLEKDRHDPRLTVILGETRRGQAACANQAWRMTQGDYVKVDNDVVILRDDWLERLLEVARRIPQAGVIAHNCESGEKYPRLGYPELTIRGVTVARTPRQFRTVAGACALIPRRTRERCGRWNEGEHGQTYNRGLDLVYSVKVRLAGLASYYTSGVRDVYAKCLRSGEPEGYAAERGQMKKAFWRWALPVIDDYQRGVRKLDDV